MSKDHLALALCLTFSLSLGAHLVEASEAIVDCVNSLNSILANQVPPPTPIAPQRDRIVGSYFYEVASSSDLYSPGRVTQLRRYRARPELDVKRWFLERRSHGGQDSPKLPSDDLYTTHSNYESFLRSLNIEPCRASGDCYTYDAVALNHRLSRLTGQRATVMRYWNAPAGHVSYQEMSRHLARGELPLSQGGSHGAHDFWHFLAHMATPNRVWNQIFARHRLYQRLLSDLVIVQSPEVIGMIEEHIGRDIEGVDRISGSILGAMRTANPSQRVEQAFNFDGRARRLESVEVEPPLASPFESVTQIMRLSGTLHLGLRHMPDPNSVNRLTAMQAALARLRQYQSELEPNTNTLDSELLNGIDAEFRARLLR